MNTEIRMRYGCNPHQAAARAYLADGHDLPIEPLNDAPKFSGYRFTHRQTNRRSA